MSEPDLDRIQQVWRNLTDDDVLRALPARTDYPPQVHMIIQTEAKRRGLSLEMCVRPALRPLSIARAGTAAVRFVWAHRAINALVFGTAIRLTAARTITLGLGDIHPALWFALFLGAYLLGLCFICWPLRAYRVVPGVALSACAGDLLVSLVSMVHYKLFVRMTGGQLLLMFVGGFFMLWAVSSMLLCAVVFLHNRYWPVYPQGHCANCGYDLRGLPVPRCPECGVRFDAERATAGT